MHPIIAELIAREFPNRAARRFATIEDVAVAAWQAAWREGFDRGYDKGFVEGLAFEHHRHGRHRCPARNERSFLWANDYKPDESVIQ